jgi:hypothetical protein
MSQKFLLSTISDVLEFCKILSNSDIDLKIVLDYPQIFSAELYDNFLQKIIMDKIELGSKEVISFNQKLEEYKTLIGGLHMWGKLKKGEKWISHAGNFNDFFSYDNTLKKAFLESVFKTFNDDMPRYFVPEVNSGEDDLNSIVTDMQNEGFKFISKKIL